MITKAVVSLDGLETSWEVFVKSTAENGWAEPLFDRDDVELFIKSHYEWVTRLGADPEEADHFRLVGDVLHCDMHNKDSFTITSREGFYDMTPIDYPWLFWEIKRYEKLFRFKNRIVDDAFITKSMHITSYDHDAEQFLMQYVVESKVGDKWYNLERIA